MFVLSQFSVSLGFMTWDVVLVSVSNMSEPMEGQLAVNAKCYSLVASAFPSILYHGCFKKVRFIHTYTVTYYLCNCYYLHIFNNFPRIGFNSFSHVAVKDICGFSALDVSSDSCYLDHHTLGSSVMYCDASRDADLIRPPLGSHGDQRVVLLLQDLPCLRKI